jgi:hypothetical protein
VAGPDTCSFLLYLGRQALACGWVGFVVGWKKAIQALRPFDCAQGGVVASATRGLLAGLKPDPTVRAGGFCWGWFEGVHPTHPQSTRMDGAPKMIYGWANLSDAIRIMKKLKA